MSLTLHLTFIIKLKFLAPTLPEVSTISCRSNLTDEAHDPEKWWNVCEVMEKTGQIILGKEKRNSNLIL